MFETNKLATVILLSYNSHEDLAECIPSLMSQTYSNSEIIVVDNASTDSSVEFIKTNYPDIKLIETGENLGYPSGNNVGFEHAEGEYIAVLNPDTIVDTKWLAELIKPLEHDPQIALTTSKILIYDRKTVINTCANSPHYTGLDFCRGLYDAASEYGEIEEVGAISGCSFVIRKEALNHLAGFDSDFFLYLEDADLSWRARLAGYKILYVPTSIVYHKFDLSVAPWKYYYLERNRYLLLLKNCSLRFLVLILPSLLLTEVITCSYAFIKGLPFLKSKLRAYWWILKNVKLIHKKRSEIQRIRIIDENTFVKKLDWKIPFEQLIDNKLLMNIANISFNSLYKIQFALLTKIL